MKGGVKPGDTRPHHDGVIVEYIQLGVFEFRKKSSFHRLFANLLNIIRRNLINVIVKPVGIKQVGVGPPGVDGRPGFVVAGEVVYRLSGFKPLFMSRSYSSFSVSASYSGCPVT